jgi:hypothetical protein
MPGDEIQGHDLESQIRLPHAILDVAVTENQVAQEKGRHQQYKG